jgi:hypothetical protein
LRPQSWFSKKIFFISAATVLGIYAWLCHECVQAKNFFSCPESWLSWRSDWPYQMLVTLPQQDLARDLLIEIKQRYAGMQNTNDLTELIQASIRDLDQELLLVAHYAKVLSWVRWINLYFIFPIDKELIGKLDNFQQRLSYLKQIIVSQVKDTNDVICHRVPAPAFGG